MMVFFRSWFALSVVFRVCATYVVFDFFSSWLW
jgi:hypothetical protein